MLPHCGETHRRTELLLVGPDRLEKWTYGSLLELSKGKHRILHLGANNPMHCRSCLAEEQRCLPGPGDPWESDVKAGLYQGMCSWQFCVELETRSGVLCPVLGFLVQDRLVVKVVVMIKELRPTIHKKG